MIWLSLALLGGVAWVIAAALRKWQRWPAPGSWVSPYGRIGDP